MAALMGIVLIGGYIALGVWCARVSWAISTSLEPRMLRLAVNSFVWAFFFAPAFVAGGHGVGVGPAWFVLATQRSSDELTRVALISLPVVWLLLFTVALIRFRVAPQNNKNKRGQDDQGSSG